MKILVRLHRKRSWAVLVLATLTGCFAMHSGSGEALLPEAGPPSSPPPADSEAVRNKTAMLFMTSRGANAILGFPATAKGDVPPSVEITGDKTGLSEPIALGVDPTSGKIYAANDPGSTILIFPKGANGNVAPLTLGGSKVPIQATEALPSIRMARFTFQTIRQTQFTFLPPARTAIPRRFARSPALRRS